MFRKSLVLMVAAAITFALSACAAPSGSLGNPPGSSGNAQPAATAATTSSEAPSQGASQADCRVSANDYQKAVDSLPAVPGVDGLIDISACLNQGGHIRMQPGCSAYPCDGVVAFSMDQLTIGDWQPGIYKAAIFGYTYPDTTKFIGLCDAGSEILSASSGDDSAGALVVKCDPPITGCPTKDDMSGACDYRAVLFGDTLPK